MERELNPVFRQAREAIEEVLDGARFRLASECHHPDAFGSARAEYRGRHERVRLTWDGKDGWLGLKVARPADSNQHPGSGGWRSLSAATAAPQQFLRPGPSAGARIAELRGALVRHLEAAV